MRKNRRRVDSRWGRWFDVLLDIGCDAATMLMVISAGWIFVTALGGGADGPGGIFLAGLLLLASAHLLRWRDDNIRVVMGLAAGSAGFLAIWVLN